MRGPSGRIHDPGGRYTNHACRQRITDAGAVANYARSGNPTDNAQAEAGWSTLTTELLPGSGGLCQVPATYHVRAPAG